MAAIFAVPAFVVPFTVAAAGLRAEPVSVSSETILGDADGNGSVSINDVTAIQCRIAEISVEESAFSELAADINGDGEVTIADATLIQQWLAEDEIAYPIGTPVEVPAEPTTVPTTAAPTQRATDESGWGRDVFRP